MAHGSTYDLWLITAITGGRGAAAAAAARVARASAALRSASICMLRHPPPRRAARYRRARPTPAALLALRWLRRDPAGKALRRQLLEVISTYPRHRPCFPHADTCPLF
jgi:hypothetical protein